MRFFAGLEGTFGYARAAAHGVEDAVWGVDAVEIARDLAAEETACDRVSGVAGDADDAAAGVVHGGQDAAAIRAIERACGVDDAGRCSLRKRRRGALILRKPPCALPVAVVRGHGMIVEVPRMHSKTDRACNRRFFMVFRSSRLAVALLSVAMLAVPCSLIHAEAQTQAHDSADMKTLPQAELDVVKVLLAQERAWNKGDLDAFASGYKNSPDTLFMANQLYHGYDEMLSRYKKNYPDKATMGTLTFSDLQPHALDEKIAIVTGRFVLERDKKHGGPASGLFSLVFEKTADGWKIILDHTS